ncbi:UDP-glucuronosyltransferase 1-7-like [Contarinia nasturtii]|uniref:UDP-glucuronosyltransferase 1-7-like n=1 Tax=Contarinia nasturtii TaxID=265458 RepID=UPI0012D41025|nr:UDP-glucuronosyltransferase 1-7-like [Contarinia nasturtii]
MKLLTITTLLMLLSITNGYKILFMVPFNWPSHWILLQHFVKALVERGHHVTAVVNIPIKNFQSPNYTEILIDPPFELEKVFSMDNMFESSHDNDFHKLELFERVSTPSSDFGLKSASMQKMIHSNDLHFDLVIQQDYFHESWLMFAYKFDAPVITICTNGHPDYFDRAMGLLTPWSHVPHNILDNEDDMTYSQRAYNLLLSLYDAYLRHWVMLPKQNEIAKRYFSHLIEEKGRPLPTVEELYKNISMIFVNTHRSSFKPRPQMPGIVNIGGAHIKPPKPLPKDLQEFMDNSKHGVIVFTLGSAVRSDAMPKEKMEAFLQVFGKLKQNVLWKFEDESFANIPSNVRVQKWMPQSDILAHEKVVLFISHGGLSGTYEGTMRGVPFLFTPLFADQFRNARKAVKAGSGLELPFSQITVETLSSKVNELLTNKTYYNRAKEIARLSNDNLVHPMEEAMFWIEYVIRSGNGAKHLKSSAVHMSWFTYLMLDILIMPFVVIFIIYRIGKMFNRK